MEAIIDRPITLQQASNIFVTFLYAASVHVLIIHTADTNATIAAIILLTCIILFILSDWLSRVRLPLMLPVNDRFTFIAQLLKTLFEVIGLVALVFAGLEVIVIFHQPSSAGISINSLLISTLPFGLCMGVIVFLFSTFFWNLTLLLCVMKVSWIDLAAVVSQGDGFERADIKEYIPHLVKRLERIRSTVADSASSSPEEAISNFIRSISWSAPQTFLRILIQIITFHIAWSSLAVGVILTLSTSFYGGTPVARALIDYITARNISRLLCAGIAITVSTICFFVIPTVNKLTENGTMLLKWCRHILLSLVYLFQLSILCIFTIAVPISSLWLLPITLFAFFFANYFSEKSIKKKRFGFHISGICLVITLLHYYLFAGPIALIILIGVQQLLINIILQYAQGDGSFVLRPTFLLTSPNITAKFEIANARGINGDVQYVTCGGAIDAEGNYTATAKPGDYKVCAISFHSRTCVAQSHVKVVTTEPDTSTGDD